MAVIGITSGTGTLVKGWTEYKANLLVALGQVGTHENFIRYF